MVNQPALTEDGEGTIVPYAASNPLRRADNRDTGWDIDFHWLCNHGDADFATS